VIATSSPAMDILKSSNVERVFHDLFGSQRTRELMAELDEKRVYQLTADELASLQSVFAADYADDAEVDSYIRETFHDDGYLMDPHTATCFKAHASCRDKALPGIVYSTAEWTKFSPTIAHALTGEVDSHDIDALRSISATANTPIPPMIAALFDKPVAQDTVIDKQDIEGAVLAFI
jgi:threonine synthase